jgi:dolichol-phosphate mannosyltransferase
MSGKCTKSLSLIIPIYNEEKIVKAAIEDCLVSLENDFEDFELIIINDGSRDGTQNILVEFFSSHPRIKLIPNYINLNQGVSVQRGHAMATKAYTVHNGIDLPLKPSEIKTHLENIGDIDVLVLERKKYSGATSWRLLTSNVNILLRKVLFPFLTSGFKDMNFTQIYRREIINKILPLAKSPAFTTPEMIIRARCLNMKIKTVDAEFQERKVGTGSLGKVHDILWTIYDMFRFRYLLWIGINKHAKVKLNE